jgi:hypothetical protein
MTAALIFFMVRYYAAVSNAIGRAWSKYRRLRGAQRELAMLGLSLAFALFVLPVIIWIAGKIFLGDYTRSPSGTPTGGPLALWVDYLRGLASAPGATGRSCSARMSFCWRCASARPAER